MIDATQPWTLADRVRIAIAVVLVVAAFAIKAGLL